MLSSLLLGMLLQAQGPALDEKIISAFTWSDRPAIEGLQALLKNEQIPHEFRLGALKPENVKGNYRGTLSKEPLAVVLNLLLNETDPPLSYRVLEGKIIIQRDPLVSFDPKRYRSPIYLKDVVEQLAAQARVQIEGDLTELLRPYQQGEIRSQPFHRTVKALIEPYGVVFRPLDRYRFGRKGIEDRKTLGSSYLASRIPEVAVSATRPSRNNALLSKDGRTLFATNEDSVIAYLAADGSEITRLPVAEVEKIEALGELLLVRRARGFTVLTTALEAVYRFEEEGDAKVIVQPLGDGAILFQDPRRAAVFLAANRSVIDLSTLLAAANVAGGQAQVIAQEIPRSSVVLLKGGDQAIALDLQTGQSRPAAWPEKANPVGITSDRWIAFQVTSAPKLRFTLLSPADSQLRELEFDLPRGERFVQTMASVRQPFISLVFTRTQGRQRQVLTRELRPSGIATTPTVRNFRTQTEMNRYLSALTSTQPVDPAPSARVDLALQAVQSRQVSLIVPQQLIAEPKSHRMIYRHSQNLLDIYDPTVASRLTNGITLVDEKSKKPMAASSVLALFRDVGQFGKVIVDPQLGPGQKQKEELVVDDRLLLMTSDGKFLRTYLVKLNSKETPGVCQLKRDAPFEGKPIAISGDGSRVMALRPSPGQPAEGRRYEVSMTNQIGKGILNWVTERELFGKVPSPSPRVDVAMDELGQLIAFRTREWTKVFQVERDTKTLLATFTDPPFRAQGGVLRFTRHRNLLVAGSPDADRDGGYSLAVMDLQSRNLIGLPVNRGLNAEVTPQGILVFYGPNFVQSLDLTSGQLSAPIGLPGGDQVRQVEASSLDVQGAETLVYLLTNEGRMHCLKASRGRGSTALEYIATHAALQGGNFVTYIDSKAASGAKVEPYYFASPAAAEILQFRVGNQSFGFDAYDLVLNRPDLVIQRIGLGRPATIGQFQKIREARLERMRAAKQLPGEAKSFPKIQVINNVPSFLATNDRKYRLELEVTDERSPISRVDVYVNGVPHTKLGGYRPEESTTRVSLDVDLELSQGINLVEIVANNEMGGIARTVQRRANYSGPTQPRNTYYVGIGISDYDVDPDLNGVADVEELADALKAVTPQGQQVFTLLKRDDELKGVDREDSKRKLNRALEDVAKFLQRANLDDLVIVHFSGHASLARDGLLRFHLPGFTEGAEDLALPMPTLEALIDATAARQRLVLLDACNTGEVSTQMLQTLNSAPPEPPNEAGLKGRPMKELLTGPCVLELSKENFADLRRGTGAMIISSSRAFEPSRDRVFTPVFIRGVRGEADRDRDGRVRINELFDYMVRTVPEYARTLGGTPHHPTTRSVNLRNDFVVSTVRRG